MSDVPLTAYAAGATAFRVGPAPRIAVEAAGSGAFVLCLHGIGGERESWRPQLESFAGEYCVAAWDARGYGDSDDYDGPLDFADMADDAARVLDTFAVERAHIVGLSMGARISLELYARHPDRFATVTLAGVHAKFEGFTPEAQRDFVEQRRKPLIDDGITPAELAPRLVGRLTAPGVSGDARALAVRSMARLHPGSYVKTVEATTRFDREHVLAEIAVPAQVIVGEHDPLTPPALTASIAARIPGARHHVVYDSGHLVNIEQPAAFDRLLADFLRPYRDRANVSSVEVALGRA